MQAQKNRKRSSSGKGGQKRGHQGKDRIRTSGNNLGLRSPGLNKRALRTSDFDITRVIFEDPSPKVVAPKRHEDVLTPAWRVIHDFPAASSSNSQNKLKSSSDAATPQKSPQPPSRNTPSPVPTTATTPATPAEVIPTRPSPEGDSSLTSLLVQLNRTNQDVLPQVSHRATTPSPPPEGPGNIFRAISPPTVPMGLPPYLGTSIPVTTPSTTLLPSSPTLLSVSGGENSTTNTTSSYLSPRSNNNTPTPITPKKTHNTALLGTDAAQNEAKEKEELPDTSCPLPPRKFDDLQEEEEDEELVGVNARLVALRSVEVDEGSSSEDTSDEAYATRHARYETKLPPQLFEPPPKRPATPKIPKKTQTARKKKKKGSSIRDSSGGGRASPSQETDATTTATTPNTATTTTTTTTTATTITPNTPTTTTPARERGRKRQQTHERKRASKQRRKSDGSIETPHKAITTTTTVAGVCVDTTTTTPTKGEARDVVRALHLDPSDYLQQQQQQSQQDHLEFRGNSFASAPFIADTSNNTHNTLSNSGGGRSGDRPTESVSTSSFNPFAPSPSATPLLGSGGSLSLSSALSGGYLSPLMPPQAPTLLSPPPSVLGLPQQQQLGSITQYGVSPPAPQHTQQQQQQPQPQQHHTPKRNSRRMSGSGGSVSSYVGNNSINNNNNNSANNTFNTMSMTTKQHPSAPSSQPTSNGPPSANAFYAPPPSAQQQQQQHTPSSMLESMMYSSHPSQGFGNSFVPIGGNGMMPPPSPSTPYIPTPNSSAPYNQFS